ncbi:MAG: LEA type 2 family protein [Burkholderiales bacterium]
MRQLSCDNAAVGRALMAMLLLAATLTGCGGLPPGAQAPSVTIADMGLSGAGLFEQQFNLRLRIQNPNPDEFRIDGIAFDLELNDQPFAKGVGNQAVTVPRYGSGFLAVEAVSTTRGLVRQFGLIAKSGRPVFKYRMRGTLDLAPGGRMPFDERGELDLSAMAFAP